MDGTHYIDKDGYLSCASVHKNDVLIPVSHVIHEVTCIKCLRTLAYKEHCLQVISNGEVERLTKEVDRQKVEVKISNDNAVINARMCNEKDDEISKLKGINLSTELVHYIDFDGFLRCNAIDTLDNELKVCNDIYKVTCVQCLRKLLD